MCVSTPASPALTGALEDYLETIYRLLRDKRVARVRDIAQARSVKPGSVSPALRRLADLGLVEYVQREYVGLTPAGERQARRVYARHRVLTRFFSEILGLEQAAAEDQACVMEHGLRDEAMERLVRLFEYLTICPNRPPDLIEAFHRCALVNEGPPGCEHACERRLGGAGLDGGAPRSVSDLRPGERAVVTQVNAQGAVRQRLLDMGILPRTGIEVERVAPAGDPVWVRLDGSQIALRKAEARAVQVVRE